MTWYDKKRFYKILPSCPPVTCTYCKIKNVQYTVFGLNGAARLAAKCHGTGRWVRVTAPLGHVKDGDELTLWSPDQLDVVCSLLEAYTE